MTILSANAIDIATKRYLNPGEDWLGGSQRVGRGIGRIERDARYCDLFSEIIYNLEFLPGGRILRNTGKVKGSLFNCYVLPFLDSIEDIGQFVKESMIVWAEGGGVGANVTHLRPDGSSINPVTGKGGRASGPISFLKVADAGAETIDSGGQRRAAGMALMLVSHPDIVPFIDTKIVHDMLNYFNISVGVTEDFVEAVEYGRPWNLTFNHHSCESVDSRWLWDLIMENMIMHAEPGLINWDNLQANNSYYFAPIEATNPCLPYETLISVADGRGAIKIGELAESGEDVPVYSLNTETNKVEIKWGRRPRKTGVKKEVWRVTLDDGSVVRATPNHKFILNDGREVELKSLTTGDSLRLTARQRDEKNVENKFKEYWHIKDGFSTAHEHRMIYNFHNQTDPYIFGHGDVIHHIDFNKLNNRHNNLAKMTKESHDILHGNMMRGENNPFFRFDHVREKLLAECSKPGKNNPRFKGYTQEEVFELACKHTKAVGRRLKRDEWQSICSKNGYPYSDYSVEPHGSFGTMLKTAADSCGVPSNRQSDIDVVSRCELAIEQGLDAFVDGEKILVNRECEGCGVHFVRPYEQREVSYCSRKCANRHKKTDRTWYGNRQEKTMHDQLIAYNDLKFNFGRDPLKREWIAECRNRGVSWRLRAPNSTNGMNKFCIRTFAELKERAKNQNHRVVSVEFDCYEDVYNMTVEDNHNYAIVLPNQLETKQYQIFTPQCGEAPLERYGICDLGSIVLPKFVSKVNTNWKRMEEVVRLGVRFLDDVIDVNRYIFPQFEKSAHDARRIGIGVMGLADYLFAKRLRYGSQKALAETDKVMRFIRDVCYDESMRLAVEKGAFPKFDPVMYGKAPFIRSMPMSTRKDIKRHTMRNCTLMAIAPTGTISLLPEVSPSIEPLMAKAYVTNDQAGRRLYVDPRFREFVRQGRADDLPEWLVDTYDLQPEAHLDTQVVVQKFTDGAVSKTINLPKGTTADNLSGLLLEYIHDVKGVTVYVDESRPNQPIKKVDVDLAVRMILDGNEEAIIGMDESAVQCASGKCDI